MKRFFKLFALILACVMLCVPLVGCDKMIKDVKTHTAFLLENGNITLNGEEFIPLPDGDYAPNIKLNNKEFSLVREGTPYLASIFSDEFTISLSNDGLFILYLFFPETYLDDGNYTVRFYCRSDVYEETIAQINKGIEYSVYGYDYTTEDGTTVTEYLSEEEAKLIDTVLSKVEPSVLTFDSYFNYDYCIYIYLHSEDLKFCIDGVELYKQGNYFYLLVYNEYDYLVYRVPWNLVDDFEKIASDAIEKGAEVYPEYYE